MKTATNATWREAAALAVTKVLQRIDQTSRQQPQAPTDERPKPQAEPANEPLDLPPLDFHTGKPVAPAPKAEPTPRPQALPPPAVEQIRLLDDPARQRIRDAYIAARFPGVARSSGDLSRVRAVIRAAQVYLEDGNGWRAEELLELAAELQPASEALLLARLEVALRLRDSEGYRRNALRFRERHPKSAHWKYVVAFARSLYITEAPFTPDLADDRGDSAYQRPHWIQDSWELAPEFMPSDLRTRVLAIEDSETELAEAA